jgi:hypothetical protein
MGQIERHFPLGLVSGIAEYKNVLDAELCKELVSCLTEDFNTLFSAGPTLGGYNPYMKRCMDTSFMNDEQYTPELRHYKKYFEICSSFDTIVWSCVADYIEQYRELWQAPNVQSTGFRIQRYERNAGYYRQHCDAVPWIETHGDSSIKRILAVVVYLNTVQDGGGTRFPMHELTVNAEVGKVVVFPTTWQYPHQGLVPLSSDKWIISEFINCSIEPVQNVNLIDEDSFITPETKFTEDE